MKDVARAANVSTATVSHVLNNTRNVNPETKAKVLKAIKDLNYNVNPIARTLRSGNSKMIGLIISDLTNLFYMDIALSIDKILSPAGYHLIYINSDENPEKERANIDNLLIQNVDGLIIAPVKEDCSYMKELIGDKCPCVFFDRKPNGFDRDYILSENYQGAYEGTELLLKKGHRQLGFVGSSYTDTMNERADGFRQALRDYGIEPDEEHIKFGGGRPLRLSEQKVGDSYSLTKQLVQQEKRTAILCGNDLAAVGAVSYLKEMKMRIPQDMGIVCFDDMFWLSMAEPPITAVDQDRITIGEKAAHVLLDRIHQAEGSYREYRIPTNMHIRLSC